MRSLVSLFILVSCLSAKQDALLIERNMDAKSCSDYFIVSSSLESNPELRKTLQKYLYKCLVDVYTCELDSTVLDRLYKRDSFNKSILLFFTDSRYEGLSHFEYPERWREGYDNLVNNCRDVEVKYQIVDTLLSLGISSGLVAVWEKAELKKLKHIDAYQRKVILEKALYKCAELAVIFHNSKHFERRNELIAFLRSESSSKSTSEKLETLFAGFEVIDHERYILEIFGGH